MSAQTISHPAVQPMPELSAWTANLQQVAVAPLAFCPAFPQIARRHEAWWQHACLDRPLFLATSDRNPRRRMSRRLELLDQPDAWLAAKLEDLQQVYRVGDTLPNIRTDFGPVLLSGLLGGRVEIGSDTTWTHAFIDDDWSNAPAWRLREDHPWWRCLLGLADRVAADAAGRYLLCTPDLGGSADVLLNLRGSEPLCLDVVEQPERVAAALAAIYPAWHRTFSELYRISTRHGAGLVNWLALWSDQPYMIPACDFNFMIGQASFNEVCLPDIARQVATVGRGVFHLDGPGAARHIDALLEVPQLEAIQFTPGAGTPSALAWVDMFRKIQDRGRSVLIMAPPDEALAVADALRPEGLAINTSASTPAELDNLFEAFCRRYGAPTG